MIIEYRLHYSNPIGVRVTDHLSYNEYKKLIVKYPRFKYDYDLVYHANYLIFNFSL